MPSASSDDKNIKEQQPTVIPIRIDILINDNQSLSSMCVHGKIITTVSPDRERIPRKKVKKKLSILLIAGNKISQEPDNHGKKSNVGSSIDGKKSM